MSDYELGDFLFFLKIFLLQIIATWISVLNMNEFLLILSIYTRKVLNKKVIFAEMLKLVSKIKLKGRR